MTNPTKTIEAINSAVDSVEEIEIPDVVTLDNGIVIRCKPVSIMTLRYATANVSKPKIPVVRNTEKDRDEEWEGDPAYQQALTEWEQQVGDVGTNVMLMLGTEIESVPDDVERPEGDKWVEMLQATGLPIDVETPSARYLTWLRFYAITTPDDLVAISTTVAGKSGVLNKDAQASLESFRSGKDGGSDLESPTEERSVDGDSVPSANGRSHLRTGGEG